MLRERPKRKKRALFAIAAILAAGLLGGSDAFVHQPRRRQDAQLERLPAFMARQLTATGNWMANLTDNWGISGHDAAVAYRGAMPPEDADTFAGLPVRAGKDAPDDIVVLRKHGFTAGYSPALRHPAWVAYRAFPCKGGLPDSRPRFKADPDAPGSPGSAAYTLSGYDRGHLAPNLAITRRFGMEGQRDTFLTSNICPQRPALNQGTWYEVEYRISEIWPRIYGPVWVIVGSVPDPARKTLRDGIDVPIGFYQIAVTESRGELRAFAVYMPQNTWRGDYARAKLTTIDELEAVTGFDFLSGLPDDVEEKLESQLPSRLWPAGFLGYLKIMHERYRKDYR
jgi:endonuclease G